MKHYLAILGMLGLTLMVSAAALAQLDAGTLEKDDVAYNKNDYSPFADRHAPDRVLWGDTHVHSSYSFDAGFFGNTLPPKDAYRFARGEEVTSSTGQRMMGIGALLRLPRYRSQ